jgi:heterodisulfide reductase subunit A
MTALELDAAICRDEFDFSNPEKVAFIQCVGSRDAKAGRNYCSHVCCANALRLADLLRAEAGSEISVFYMDIQTFDRNPGRYFAHAKDRVRLIRSIPAEVRRGADGRPQVVYQGPEEKREIESFDRVVLSVGISPPDVRILRESLPLALDPHGFLQVSESDVPGAPGFFVTGAAKGPRSIAETMSDALLTARSVKRFLDS